MELNNGKLFTNDFLLADEFFSSLKSKIENGEKVDGFSEDDVNMILEQIQIMPSELLADVIKCNTTK